MRPDMMMRKQQQGLGLISAIFIITIGALLAAAMASVMQLGQQAQVQSFQATRAMQAAESGIQLEMVRLVQSSVTGACQASNSYDFGNAAGLRGCSASTTCELSTVNGQEYVNIESTGRCGGGTASLGSASRRVGVRALKP